MKLFGKSNKKDAEPQYYMSLINNPVLNYKVYVMKPMEKLLVFLLTFIAGGAVGLIFYGGLFKSDGKATLATFVSNVVVFVVAGIISSKIFIPTVSNTLKEKRNSKLKLQFRDFLDSLSNSLSGGMNINDALRNAYNDLEAQYSSDSYIVREVGEMLNGVQNNIPIEELLRDFGTRSDNDDISNFATVFETAYRTGGNIKEIIRRTTDIISEKVMISEEIQTKLTSNKMQMKIMNIIPIFLVLMLRTSSSEFDASFARPIGVICMTVGIGFFIAAYKMGKKLTDIKG